MPSGAVNDAIDRAFLRRRIARLPRLLELAERDAEGASAGSMRGRALRRDVAILRAELNTLQAAPPSPPGDPESERIELEAEIRELEETLHIADNASVYLVRARAGGADVPADVHRAQRWIDRLRRDLATSALPAAPSLAEADLDAALAAEGAPALERVHASIELVRRALRDALDDRHRRAHARPNGHDESA